MCIHTKVKILRLYLCVEVRTEGEAVHVEEAVAREPVEEEPVEGEPEVTRRSRAVQWS